MPIRDAIGIGLSGVCLVHCLGLPLLISAGPALVWPALVWFENEYVHLGLAVLALLAFLVAIRSWPRSGLSLVLGVVGVAGLTLLFAGALIEMSEIAERIVTVIGAVMLASAHLGAWLMPRRGHGHQMF